MAVVQLADIYEPLTFQAAVDEAAIESNAFLASGVMVESPQLSAMASVGGSTGELPFHTPLDKSGEPDYTTDDPTDLATPAKIGTAKQIWRLANMHKSWSTMDLTRELALMDPLAAITSKIGHWWGVQMQKRVIATINGILADNDANDNDDMFVNIYSDVASPAASNIIDAASILDASQTMGDAQGVLGVIAMHSITFNNLNKQNLIDFIPNSRGEINFPTYLGKRVVVDDTLPVVAGTNSPKYVTVLFAAGALDNGKGVVLRPSELERVANAGNGGGQDIIHTRRAEIIHPYGFQWVEGTIAGQSPTLAELAAAAHWDRVVDRKNVGIAFLLHNN